MISQAELPSNPVSEYYDILASGSFTREKGQSERLTHPWPLMAGLLASEPSFRKQRDEDRVTDYPDHERVSTNFAERANLDNANDDVLESDGPTQSLKRSAADMEYIILEDDSVEKLIESVNQHIKMGWRPLGGVSCWQGGDIVYLQAMTTGLQ